MRFSSASALKIGSISITSILLHLIRHLSNHRGGAGRCQEAHLWVRPRSFGAKLAPPGADSLVGLLGFPVLLASIPSWCCPPEGRSWRWPRCLDGGCCSWVVCSGASGRGGTAARAAASQTAGTSRLPALPPTGGCAVTHPAAASS